MYGQVVTPPRGLSASVIGEADFDGRLAPSSSVIPFGELAFLRIGESELCHLLPFPLLEGPLTCLFNSESMAPSSALPIGATRTVNEMHPIPLDPALSSSGLLNAIVALLASPVHPEETERYDEEVLDLQVSGFLAMFVFTISHFDRSDWEPRTNVDVPNRKLTILSPSPGSFSGRTATIGSFEWSES
jgi:polyribonucleotide 5'-hydroxyl-kinase